MAHWYSFYHDDDDDAEIKVGMYDRWLCQVQHGPTQAERVLVHTEMMDLAHERRFVVAERSLNMKDFELEHSWRVGKAIGHLEQHFINKSLHEFYDPVHFEIQLNNNMSRGTKDVKDSSSDLLLGLVASHAQEGPAGVEFLTPSHCDSQTPSLSQSLQLLSDLCTPDPRTLVDIGDPIDADDTDSNASQEEMDLAALKNFTRKRRRISSTRPRLLREIRLRKEPKHCKPAGTDSRLPRAQSVSLIPDPYFHPTHLNTFDCFANFVITCIENPTIPLDEGYLSAPGRRFCITT